MNMSDLQIMIYNASVEFIILSPPAPEIIGKSFHLEIQHKISLAPTVWRINNL